MIENSFHYGTDIVDMELNNRIEPYDLVYYTRRLRIADVHERLSGLKTASSQFMFTRNLLHEQRLLPTKLTVENYDHPLVWFVYRHKGNMLFDAKQFEEAAKFYTMCLVSCVPDTECFALTLGNRSAAYFHMGQYKRSLMDVHWAMVLFNYPADLAYKLYYQAGNTKRILGDFEHANKFYAECLARLDPAKMEADEKVKFCEDVRRAIIECKELQLGAQKITEEIPTNNQPVGGRNENIPALSAYLELKISENMGRGVYATRDINPGDIVAIDEPHISNNTETVICHYNGCLKLDIMSLTPCPRCALVNYCSKDCMDKAYNDGHFFECRFMIFIKKIPGVTRMYELALKWFFKDYLQMGLEKYCSTVHNFSKSKVDPMTRGFDENGQFNSYNFLTAYSLDSNENNIPKDLLFFYNCVAAEMFQYLILSGFKIPDHYFGFVGASLVHILIVLDFNCDKVFTSAPNISYDCCTRSDGCIYKIQKPFILYPSIALFNHSCDPNVTTSRQLFDRKRVLKAIQPIPKGSQLFITYGAIFPVSNTQSRKQIFKKKFKFKCYCQPCQKNWPSFPYIPNRLSTLNILNIQMADTVISECKKFIEFSNTVDEKNYGQHLNYLYSFCKLLLTNVKRPFELYENCLQMIHSGQYGT